MPRRSCSRLGFILLLLIACGPPLVVCAAQFLLGNPERLLLLPFVLLLHHGLSLSNTLSVFDAFRGSEGAFERTPKYGRLSNEHSGQAASKEWKASTYARGVKDRRQVLREIAMVAILTTAIIVGVRLIQSGADLDVMVVPWLIFFDLSFLYLLWLRFDEH